MPEDFQKVRLGDVAELIMGQSPPSQFVHEEQDRGTPFLQGNAEFGDVFPEPKYSCDHPARTCGQNDVLISVRAPVGELNLADQSYCIGRGLAAVRFIDLPSTLGAKLLEKFSPQLQAVAQGTTFQAIGRSELSGLQLLLPPPREWNLIDEVLGLLDSQIHETEALIAKLEQIRQGLLADLLTRGIDHNGQLRPPPDQAPQLYKDSPLGKIPKRWEVQPLGRNSEIVSGITLSGQNNSSSGTPTPYLRVANVQDGYLDLAQVKTIRATPQEINRYRLLPGDVLMNEGGDFDKLGRGTIWRGEIETCIHQNHVFRVRTESDTLNPEYLAAFSASSQGKKYFVLSSKQSTNLASINSTQLKAFPIPVPPIGEQALIVSQLQAFQDRTQREEESRAKLTSARAGLVDDLLTGRVRVTPLLEASSS